jgi:hypothetical protein
MEVYIFTQIPSFLWVSIAYNDHIKVFVLSKVAVSTMMTNLEEEWMEARNVRALFPELAAIAGSNPVDAYKEMKKNRKVGDATLAELVDAAWWCVYGMLYSTEDDRTNSLPHDDYFYKETNFIADVVTLLKCESMRVETGAHRYPVPKRGSGSAGKKKVKRFNEYRDFVVKSTMALVKEDGTCNPDICKVTTDMIRCSQERLIGYEPNDVASVRQEQYVAIGNFLDDVFIHRGYVRKIQEEGAEMLTPEQLDEWETAKDRVRQHCNPDNNEIPGFVRGMANQSGFMVEVLP